MASKIITITVPGKPGLFRRLLAPLGLMDIHGVPPVKQQVELRSLTAAQVIEADEGGHHKRMAEALEARTLAALLREQLAFLGLVFPGIDFGHAFEGQDVVSDTYAALWDATRGEREESAGPGAAAGSP